MCKIREETKEIYFNPRSRVGSDKIRRALAKRANQHFNPRSRVGSDAYYKSQSMTEWHFNPRSRVGSDRIATITVNAIIWISIRAPAWGATALHGGPEETY